MDNLTRKDNQAQKKHKVNWLFFLNNKGEVNIVTDPGTDGSGGSGPEASMSPSAAPAPASAPLSWKSSLGSGLANSPLIKKFDDTPEGLNQAFTSHANLEQLLGHEKVPIPKGDDDTEGWNRFSKAMGIPDKAEAYGLPDPAIPESMKGMTIDKQKFAEVVHAHKLTPAQAKGIWEAYSQISIDSYNQAMEQIDKDMDDTITRLKGEWGDAFTTNVELGQAVINKFAGDQESIDYVTSALGKDARGIKFLTKIGEQFAENKVGEFQMKRFSLAPEEAQAEVDKMTRDLEGPYMNTAGKFTQKEHQAAIDRVNYLRASINRARG